MQTIGDDGGGGGFGAGRRWAPWPELMPDQHPVLVVPFAPERPATLEDGWSGADAPPPPVHPEWSAAYDSTRLVITRPDGAAWYDGPLGAARDWARALRAHRALLIVTGPFTSPFDLQGAAQAGLLRLLAVPARLVDHHTTPAPGTSGTAA